MRYVLILSICMLIFSILPSNVVYAEDKPNSLEDGVNETLDRLDFTKIDTFIEDNIEDKELINSSIRELVSDIIKGKITIGFNEIIHLCTRYIARDILGYLPIAVTVIGVSVLFSIVSGLSAKFTSRGTTEMLYFVCYITIIVAVLVGVTLLIKDATKVISGMHNFMEIIFPVLLTLIASLGGVVSVSSYKPLMGTLTFVISGLVTKIILPLFIATIVFCIIGNLSDSMKLDKMNKSIKSGIEVILGLLFSLFSTFVSVQGITGSAIDSVSIKSAKFAISSYVPILGGYLSDGFDLTLASSVLIKNALGVVGIIVMLLFILSPVIKILLFSLVMKITAGIVEPITDSRISSFVYSIGENMTLLIAIILGVAFMFFITSMLVILSLNSIV